MKIERGKKIIAFSLAKALMVIVRQSKEEKEGWKKT